MKQTSVISIGLLLLTAAYDNTCNYIGKRGIEYFPRQQRPLRNILINWIH